MNNPYGHVPIPLDGNGLPRSILDTPVYHDGSAGSDLLSGELRCCLTALTPLIAANDQFEIRDVEDATILRDGKVIPPESWSFPQFDGDGNVFAVAPDKKVIEPLRDRLGRVLISGSAIKGMLATSLGAMLAAPMARVEERTFSYRPNLTVPGANAVLQPRPAIVENWDETTRTLTVQVLPSAAMQQVIFIRSEVARKLPASKPRHAGALDLTDAALQTHDDRGKKLPARRLVPSGGASFSLSGHQYFRYFGGMDGTGDLAAAFGGGRIYRDVLVPDALVPDAGTPGYVQLDITDPVLGHHQATIDHLSDRDQGHLRGEHPLTGKMDVASVSQTIRQSADNVKKPGALIYVEVSVDPRGNPVAVTSFGQNFRYRWRYRDTVRTHWAQPEPVQRSSVMPHPEERELEGTGRHRRPRRLTGARLLTGYAVDAKNPGLDGLGTGDHEQLAGRIAINLAVEQVAEDAEDQDRFMSAQSACVVPLKVLGIPRASAECEYLDQSLKSTAGYKGAYVSYGDTLDQVSGDLAGRKFYRHQPDAATQNRIYRGSHLPGQVVDYANLESNQSVIARFVSKPGTVFRFTLRFRDLRPWELGAVLACLRPGLVEDPTAPLAEPGNKRPTHAVKLGHGRPIGLGSVRIDFDRILLLSDLLEGNDDPAPGEELARQALAAFEENTRPLGNSVKTAWLDLHRYDGAGPCDYRRPEGGGESYDYYTGRRRTHTQIRRNR